MYNVIYIYTHIYLYCIYVQCGFIYVHEINLAIQKELFHDIPAEATAFCNRCLLLSHDKCSIFSISAHDVLTSRNNCNENIIDIYRNGLSFEKCTSYQC